MHGDYSKTGTEGKKEFIERHISLVKYVVMRIKAKLPSHIDVDDLISAGVVGLMDAAEKFDPKRGIQFKTYAEMRIKGAVLDELRALDWAPRTMRREIRKIEDVYAELENRLGREPDDEEMAEEMKMDLDEYYQLLGRSKSVSVISFEDLNILGDREGQEILEVLSDPSVDDPFAELNMAEIRDVLTEAIEKLPESERLVLTLYYYEELNMKEIGKVMDKSESRVSQLRTKALVRLRTRLKKALEGEA